MPMHNSPHPGEFIREVHLEPNGIIGRQLAAKLSVSPSALNRVLQGTSGISPIACSATKATNRLDISNKIYIFYLVCGESSNIGE